MCIKTILTKIATFAPSLLHIRARALPTPRPAPVTRTVWPAKRAEDIIIEIVVMGSVAPMMMIRRVESNFSVIEELSDAYFYLNCRNRWGQAIIHNICRDSRMSEMGWLRVHFGVHFGLVLCWSLSLLSEMENAVPPHKVQKE